MSHATPTSEIDRVCIRTASPDPLAARQRVERALSAVSFQPNGLPRDAILLVRQLNAPRTGAPDWARAVAARLDGLAQQAARPLEGAVPANAAAVLFADRSELLACLALDWCAGDVLDRWWWRSVLRQRDVTRAVVEAWLQTPEHIPAALGRLDARRQAVAFVRKLDKTDAHSMLTALVHTFGLAELSAQIDPLEPPRAPAFYLKPNAPLDDDPPQPQPYISASGAPWQHWIGDHEIEQLPVERQVLLGVGLMLQRASSVVRTEQFARQAAAWQEAIRHIQQTQPVTERKASEPISIQPQPRVSVPAAELAPLRQESFGVIDTFVEPLTQAASLPRTHLADNVDVPSAPMSEIVSAAAQAQEFETPEPTEDEIETEFGGAFYLINLGIYLNLYGDFTTPLQLGLDLAIWDFVALMSVELIGLQVMLDPVWALLARLAGRAQDEPPGAQFDPPGHQSLRDWLNDLMRTVGPRLQLALGVDDDDLARYFTQRARVRVSATRLDVYFALAELPIEVRLSGLDRDPGWVPAAGRFIRFHYD